MTFNTSITRSTQSAVMLERPMSTSSSIDNSFQFHDSYMRAVDALRKHLVGMSNPLLRKEIQMRLHEVANGVIDERKGIDANFTELNLPVDTRELIDELSRQIREEARQSQGAIEKMMPAIKEDLLSLSTEKGVDSMSPESLLKKFVGDANQEVEEEIDAKTQKIIQLELTQEKVKEWVKELKTAQTNSHALSKEQQSELQKHVDATTNPAVIDVEKYVQSLTEQEIEELNKNMSNMSEKELNLRTFKARIDELSIGNQLVELEHVHYHLNHFLQPYHRIKSAGWSNEPRYSG